MNAVYSRSQTSTGKFAHLRRLFLIQCTDPDDRVIDQTVAGEYVLEAGVPGGGTLNLKKTSSCAPERPEHEEGRLGLRHPEHHPVRTRGEAGRPQAPGRGLGGTTWPTPRSWTSGLQNDEQATSVVQAAGSAALCGGRWS